MQWAWEVVPMNTPWGMQNYVYAGPNATTLFIRDVDNAAEPMDAPDCERRFEALFKEAEASPELVELVEKEVALEYGHEAAKFRDLLHNFVRRDHLLRGRGCPQCS